jgi:hypothetical protein
MILRFMRDGAMTWQAQRDQTEFGAWRKTLRGFVVSLLSHRSGKTTDRFEIGDPHDFCRDTIGAR